MFEVGTIVNASSLVAMGLIKSDRNPVKILGNGEITKSFKVIANKFSQTAKDKIIAAGGSIEETL